MSVLVPVYNHDKYVVACLDSIAIQTGVRIELIVIDDGSADDSANRVETWVQAHRDRFVRVVFERQANAGLVATLNRMVDLAEGDYVTFIASDDLLLPGALDFRIATLQAHPDALALFTDCTVIDGEGQLMYDSGIGDLHGQDVRLMNDRNLVASLLLLQFSVPGPVFTARRVAYDSEQGVGLYDTEHYPEDLDFYLRLARTGRFLFRPERTAAYRLHGENSVYEQNAKIHEGIRAILAHHGPTLPPYERLLAWLYRHASVPPERWPWRKRTPTELASRLAMGAMRTFHRARLALFSKRSSPDTP